MRSYWDKAIVGCLRVGLGCFFFNTVLQFNPEVGFMPWKAKDACCLVADELTWLCSSLTPTGAEVQQAL